MEINGDYLKPLLEAARPSLPKSIFIRNYLPLLFDESPAKFNLTWLDEVAMNIYLEVAVTNADGSVAFMVPPLKSTYETEYGDDNFYSIASQMQQQASVNPVLAERRLSQQLPKLLNFNSDRNPEHEARWRDIITQCGYAHMLAPTSAVVNDLMGETQKTSSIQEDYNNTDDGWD